jgi:hypothetical protein
MIFRSKKGRGQSVEDPRATAKLLEEVDALQHANGAGLGPPEARRLLQLRHSAGLRLVEEAESEPPGYPTPAFGALPGGPEVPEVHAGDVTPELVRAAMLRSGCLLIRGLVESAEATGLVEEVDRAIEARNAYNGAPQDGGYYEEFEPVERFAKDLAFGRAVLKSSGGGGLWAADSPLVMSSVLGILERVGFRRLATGYLGERPAISVDKCVLRRVGPDIFGEEAEGDGPKPSAWHQDGAFMGDVQALNIWLSLTRSGDVAPGLDLVPRRLDGIVPTGTEGATFDWSVSQKVAEETAGEAGIVRPLFGPGDALLFDELCLHSTAAEPDMPSVRYAVESWFFAPSGFPTQYAPLAF